MAEMKFNCPKCAQLIACDELWSGHQIQCPTCQAPITVPGQAAAPAAPSAPKTLVPEVPKTSAPRLSIGQTRHVPSATPPQASATSTSARLAAGFVKEKKKGGALKAVLFAVVFLVFAAGGYFGFTKIKEMQDKSNDKAKQAAANSDGGEFGHAKALYDVLDATEPGGRMMGGSSARRRPPVTPTPTPGMPQGAAGNPAAIASTVPQAVVPPTYTLDTNSIKIAESKVNGTISGTNFVADAARLDVSAGALILRFYQGQLTSPDRAVLLYLHLKPGEKLAGHTWSVGPDTKGGPQIIKMWKPMPTAMQPTTKNFSTGYAMNLELGQIANRQLSGKIYLALPDQEQSVVAGVFEAATTLPDTTGTGAAATNAAAASRSPAETRYGRP